MKDKFRNRNWFITAATYGFSTLEMLIAASMLILTLTAVVLVSFGNQSVIADSQADAEAMSNAQALLEKTQADSRKDFKLVNPVAAVADGIYQKKIDVVTQPDFLTKKVTATINWTGDHNRSQSVTLAMLVTDFNNAAGGDTCDSVLIADWQHPHAAIYAFNAGNLLPAGTPGNYLVSDIDAYHNKLYVTANNAALIGSSPTVSTFFIFDITNRSIMPQYVSSLDNNSSDSTGLNAVAVADDVTSGKRYAYVANGYGANFSTCAQGNNCAQLQIIDVTNPASPALVSNIKMTGVTGGGGQGVGKTIFYQGGIIYLGLAKPAGGAAFHIIDVHNPLAPFEVSGGTYPVGNAINALTVKNGYAYLATPNSQELLVMNVSNPASPQLVGGYDAPDRQGNGKSVMTIGDTLYLGRTVTAANPEFYILNDSDPTQLTANNATPHTQEIGSSIINIIIRDYLAFLLTTKQSTNPGQFQIWRVDNPAAITPYYSHALPDSGGSTANTGSGTAMDCEGDYLYAGSVDGGNNGFISVFNG